MIYRAASPWPAAGEVGEHDNLRRMAGPHHGKAREFGRKRLGSTLRNTGICFRTRRFDLGIYRSLSEIGLITSRFHCSHLPFRRFTASRYASQSYRYDLLAVSRCSRCHSMQPEVRSIRWSPQFSIINPAIGHSPISTKFGGENQWSRISEVFPEIGIPPHDASFSALGFS